jgi:hypothetical protein
MVPFNHFFRASFLKYRYLNSSCAESSGEFKFKAHHSDLRLFKMHAIHFNMEIKIK